ncbi:MAG: 30S ribosomal protein S2 [Candidatus Midichloria sp.]|uniref:30S ribosomal protein S2 n=1 Tax=Hyalomma marginatum TaxID=34627 RepID=A0A8S4C3N3_9ACAR|nr:30S ribosomal protein S2 [Hyalomma marginatum]CAG7592432.1 30S ribosomal protein S2 [Hyalomma marginatum]
MNQSKFTIQQLFEAGVHFGHRKNLWNPKMSQYIYGVRNNMHIVNLKDTYYMLNVALDVLKSVAAKNGKILFVGTKRQATEVIAENAQKCGQHYVNYRWPGGMLTNWHTVSRSLKTLEEFEKQLADKDSLLTKKERLNLTKKKEKLEKMLGGIRNMNGLPDLIFVIDTNEQRIAIEEANKLNIPVIAVVDTNASLEGVTYVVPGNDDASKAIKLYMNLAQESVLEGIQQSLIKAGVDIGAAEKALIEDSASFNAEKE